MIVLKDDIYLSFVIFSFPFFFELTHCETFVSIGINLCLYRRIQDYVCSVMVIS